MKTLLIVRHAHRDKFLSREIDNGLSAKGKKQAKVFSKQFRRLGASGAVHLVSSPKKRCVETLQPLSKRIGKRIAIEPLLDEQTQKESSKSVEYRVRKFLARWKKTKSRFTVICSHGDWIPKCARLVLGYEVLLEKGAWMLLEMGKGNSIVLKWVVQRRV